MITSEYQDTSISRKTYWLSLLGSFIISILLIALFIIIASINRKLLFTIETYTFIPIMSVLCVLQFYIYYCRINNSLLGSYKKIAIFILLLSFLPNILFILREDFIFNYSLEYNNLLMSEKFSIFSSWMHLKTTNILGFSYYYIGIFFVLILGVIKPLKN
jgi:hypothetical protein